MSLFTKGAVINMNENKIKPHQWVYIIETNLNRLKVGVASNPAERISTLERIGGFQVTRQKLIGPFQNGYQVEAEIHKRFNAQRIIEEWFSVSFEDGVQLATSVAKEIGDSRIVNCNNTGDCQEILDAMCPDHQIISDFLEDIYNVNIKITQGEDETIWLESEEYGLFKPDFLQAFMKLEKIGDAAL